jgi:PAS domain S-box-containing protein
MKSAVESPNAVYTDFFTEEKIRVLHVDNDAPFLAVAQHCLEGQGPFQVDTALSAREALEKLRNANYDVVVADYQMPGKNGLELLKELRQKGNDVPFILFTCAVKEEIAIEALNSGVEQYIDKQGNAETTYEKLKHSILSAVKRRRMEKRFKESENFLRQITENIQDMLVLAGDNLRITYASSSVKGILGYKPSETIGKPICQFIHPDDLTALMEAMKEVLRDRSGGKLEIRCKHADGSYVLMEGAAQVLTDKNNQVTGMVITARDITEQKKAEEALNTSEEKYRKLFEEAMDAIFIADAETGILIDCNRAATELVGGEKSEIIGMHQHSLHPKEKVSGKFTRTFKQHLTDKEGITVEAKIITKNGEVKDAAIKANLFEVNGRKMLRGSFRDITESKKISEQAQFQARLLNAVGQAIIGTDTAGNIIYWNHAAEQLYGWSEAEVLGRNIVDITPAATSKEQAAKILSKLISGESWSGEFVAKRRDGTPFSAIVTDAPITNDEGEIIGIIGVSTDISEQKWMQEVFNDAIGKVVELNEKLHVVGSLTRHDVRNKLAAVNGRIFLLKKKLGGNTEALLQLREMELAAQQMLRILEFERIYEQVGVEELKHIDVERHLNEAVSLFSDLKGAELINECHGLTVLADSLLRQVFYNLFDNSLKYGEKISKIRVHYKEEGDQLKLTYEDDGVGITEDVKCDLFKEGFGKGTGYGLYLIKRICEAYDWTIQETGKHGQGAQFTMTIPRNNKNGEQSYEIS